VTPESALPITATSGGARGGSRSWIAARRRKQLRAATLQAAAIALAIPASLVIGAVATGPSDLCAAFEVLAGMEPQTSAAAIIAHVRLPRVLLAAAVGATLGLCGAALQGLFRNPLAEPALLGMSAGAATAVVGVTVLGRSIAPAVVATLGAWMLPFAAFAGALASIAFVHRISLESGRTVVPTMLLAGIGVNALAGAVTGFLLTIASDAQLRSVTFWSLGSLAGASWTNLAAAAPFFLVAAWMLPRLAISLNALTLGEAEAADLGVDVESVTRRILVSVSLATAAAVAMSGIIGFVGLAAPHLVRLSGGGDHRTLLPSSMFAGALLLILADAGARTLAAPVEIPIGVLTAIGGAPLLLWMLRRDRGGEGSWR
jgi:iron complex transport system permease protein